MKIDMTERCLTVSSLFSESGAHHELIPFLRLRGKWLERAGFAVGGRVTVKVLDGYLVIIPLVDGSPAIPLPAGKEESHED